MASSVRLKPLNCSRLPCVYAQETLTFLLTQKKTCVKNYVQKDRKSGSAGMPRPISYAVFCLKKKRSTNGSTDHRGHAVSAPDRTGRRPAAAHSCVPLLSCSTMASDQPHIFTNSLYSSLWSFVFFLFFFTDTPTTEIYTLSLHDALPICVYLACTRRKH